MCRSQAYRLIDAWLVIDNLSPIGDMLPVNEAQARPLARLDPLKQRAAWKRFLATGKDLTASNIKAVIHVGNDIAGSTPAHLTDRISEAYKAAVTAMLEQVRLSQNDRWQTTSRQAALLWNRVIRERILAKVPENG